MIMAINNFALCDECSLVADNLVLISSLIRHRSSIKGVDGQCMDDFLLDLIEREIDELAHSLMASVTAYSK